MASITIHNLEDAVKEELEKRGELIRSGVSPKVFPSGHHIPGAPGRFLAGGRGK